MFTCDSNQLGCSFSWHSCFVFICCSFSCLRRLGMSWVAWLSLMTCRQIGLLGPMAASWVPDGRRTKRTVLPGPLLPLPLLTPGHWSGLARFCCWYLSPYCRPSRPLTTPTGLYETLPQPVSNEQTNSTAHKAMARRSANGVRQPQPRLRARISGLRFVRKRTYARPTPEMRLEFQALDLQSRGADFSDGRSDTPSEARTHLVPT